MICGSRGCQVTVGFLWKHFWKGPTLLINAGTAITKTPLPHGVFPVLVPCGRDTKFCHHTSDGIERLKASFARDSSVQGIMVKLPDQPHMPVLTELLLPLVEMTLTRSTDVSRWISRLPRPCEVEKLEPNASLRLSPAHQRRSRSRSKSEVAIVRNPRHARTLLRATAKAASEWTDPVDNDTQVHVGKRITAADGHVMYKVRAPNGAKGYIYERNLRFT